MFNNSKKESYKGYLYKWTNYVRGYQKRWFVLSNGCLSYYRNQHEASHTCRGTINLATSYIKIQDPCTIVISNEANQTFHLKALSEHETHQWITALHLAKNTAIQLISEEDSDYENPPCVAVASRIVYNRPCDTSSLKSDQYTEQCFPDTSQRELDQRLYDLGTSVNLVKKNSDQLFSALREFNKINLTKWTSNLSINTELSSSFDLKAPDRLSLYNESSGAINQDPRSPPHSASGQMTEFLQSFREKNKLFNISVQACVNLCSEFVNRAPVICSQYQRVLSIEKEQRLRLENMVEELAKQLSALEKKATKKFESESIVNTNNLSASHNKDEKEVAKTKNGEPTSDNSDEECFFDAIEDEHIFNVSLPRPVSQSNMNLQPQHTLNEYESCDSDSEYENDNPKSNTVARVIVRSNDNKRKKGEKKPAHKSINDIAQSHRRTASSGFPNSAFDQSQSDPKKVIQSLEGQDILSKSQDDSGNMNNLSVCGPSSNDIKSAKSVPSLVLETNKKVPKIRRKTITPRPNLSISLWGIMKNCIGKELSKIPVPVNFNEPLSMIQRLTEDFEYSECLDAAAACKDSIEQMAMVAAFTVSSYSTTTSRTGKPFNPLLGETFECDRTDDKGWKSLAEQVSHHPPAAALHCESNKGWKCWQEFTMSSKFRGKYLAIIPLGMAHLKFTGSNNHYTWRKVTSTVHNIIVGKLWIDNHGEMDIYNHTTGDTCHLTYKPYSYFSREPARRVTGVITDKSGVTRYVLNGTWDDHFEGAKVMEIRTDKHNQQVFETGPTETLWKRVYPPDYTAEMYNFTEFALTLNEPEEGVAPTDSRLRPDQRLMENGNWDEANKVKEQLEEKQRLKRRITEKENEERKKNGVALIEHKPTWFVHVKDEETYNMGYVYNDNYWRTKDNGQWSLDLPNIF